MTMVLPERTVDAWTATYITGRRWRARLWAPTERKAGERYDLGVGLGNVRGSAGLTPHGELWPDKVFVLEHKGVHEGPRIHLTVRQLLTHLIEDDARGGGLVYYVLPDPEWTDGQRAPYGKLPQVSDRRTRGPRVPGSVQFAWDGFQTWAFVAHVYDVARMVSLTYRHSPSRFTKQTSGKFDLRLAINMAEVHSIDGLTALRDFLSGVRRCEFGRRAWEPSLQNGSAIDPDAQLGTTKADLVTALRSLVGDQADGDGKAPRDDGQDAVDRHVPDGDAADDEEVVGEPSSAITFYGVGDVPPEK